MAKSKMSGKVRLTVILIPIMVVLVAAMIVVTSVMNYYSSVMSRLFGYGEIIVTKAENAEDLDGSKYYDFKTSNTTESKAYAKEVIEETMAEGAVLLKNEGVGGGKKALPLAGKGVTLFGVRTRCMNMSGGELPKESDGYSIDDALTKRGWSVNPSTLNILPTDNSSSCPDELEWSKYESALGSNYADYDDAAIVTFTRNSGEGNDQSRDPDGTGGRTGLSLSAAELTMLDNVCKKFGTVVVLVNSPNTMELGFIKDGASYKDKYTGTTYDFSNIKAALWVGGVGNTGCLAIVDILEGKVNPSGHLVDTYDRDHKNNPTWNNFGNYQYSNGAAAGSYSDNSYFVEYEEGVYVGYKYYETAAYEASKGNYAGFDYSAEVVYPFGYGLSYTAFEMKYNGTPSYDAKTDEFTFKVDVKNTGATAGKAVAQIYCNVPYVNGGVEKPYVQLVGFAKTPELAPNSDPATVEIKVKRDYITSYDYKTAKCYILDSGDYTFWLSENSHSWANIAASDTTKAWTYNLADKIVFDENNKRSTDETAAVNQFDEELNWKFKEKSEAAAGYATDMSRANFTNTFPTAPAGNDFVASQYVLDTLKKYDVTKDTSNLVTEMPITGSSATKIQLIDLRGVEYDDHLWEQYMDQFTAESLYYMFRDGGWVEHADVANGVPESYDLDGPYGFFNFSAAPDAVKWYCSEPVLAATWNTDMAAKVGDALAEEAHIMCDNIQTGWYGPGLNIHRSPFGGRNYEYFSEDAILSGKMVVAETSAASEKGLICFIKHFVANDQETNRQNNGIATWMNEQALREIYIRPFEIYTKEAKMTVKYYADADGDNKMELVSKEMPAANGIMTSYNRVGAVWAGASDAVNKVLRAECGFVGTSLTDAGGGADQYMCSDLGLRNGGTDILLSTGTLKDYQSATAISALKDACHRILYNKANANCMVGLTPGSTFTYGMAPWQVGIMIAWIVVGICVVAGAAVVVLACVGVIKFKDKV